MTARNYEPPEEQQIAIQYFVLLSQLEVREHIVSRGARYLRKVLYPSLLPMRELYEISQTRSWILHSTMS